MGKELSSRILKLATGLRLRYPRPLVNLVLVVSRPADGSPRPLVGRAVAGGQVLTRLHDETEADFCARVEAAQVPGEVSIAT